MNSITIVLFALVAIAFSQNLQNCAEYCPSKVNAQTTTDQLWTYPCVVSDGTTTVNSNCLQFSCQVSNCTDLSKVCGGINYLDSTSGKTVIYQVSCPPICANCIESGLPCIADRVIIKECLLVSTTAPLSSTPLSSTPLSSTPTATAPLVSETVPPPSVSATVAPSSTGSVTTLPKCDGFCTADTANKECLTSAGVVKCPLLCSYCTSYAAGTLCLTLVNGVRTEDKCNATVINNNVESCNEWCLSAPSGTQCKLVTSTGATLLFTCPSLFCEKCSAETQGKDCLAFEMVNDVSSPRVRKCNITTVQVLSATSCNFTDVGAYPLSTAPTVCPCDKAAIYKNKEGNPMQCACSEAYIKCFNIERCPVASEAGVAAACITGQLCSGENQICDCPNGFVRCAPKEVVVQNITVVHGDECKVDTDNTLLRTVFQTREGEICNCIFNDQQVYTSTDAAATLPSLRYGLIACRSALVDVVIPTCPTFFAVGDFCDVEVKSDSDVTTYVVNTKACLPSENRQCYCSPKEFTTVTQLATDGLKQCKDIISVSDSGSCKLIVSDPSLAATVDGVSYVARCANTTETEELQVCACKGDQFAGCIKADQVTISVPSGRAVWNCPETVVDPICTTTSDFVEGGECDPSIDYFMRWDSASSRCSDGDKKCRCLKGLDGNAKWNCGANQVISDTCAASTQANTDATTSTEASICKTDFTAESIPESAYDIGIDYVFRVKVDVTLKSGVAIPVDTISEIIAIISERGGALVFISTNLPDGRKNATSIIYIPKELYDKYKELVGSNLKRQTTESVTDAIKADLNGVFEEKFVGIYDSIGTDSFTSDSLIAEETTAAVDSGDNSSASGFAVAVLAILAAVL